MDEKTGVLKTYTMKMFDHLMDVNLFTQKFRISEHIVEKVSMIERLAYLVVFLYRNVNFTIKKFIRMASMQKVTTIEEALCGMNAKVTFTKHIASKTFEIKRTLLSRDGTIVSPDTVFITTFSLIRHITKNGKATNENYSIESVPKLSKASDAIPFSSPIVLKAVRSEYICRETSMAQDDYDARNKTIQKG